MLRIRTLLAVTVLGSAAFAGAPLVFQEMELPRPTAQHKEMQQMGLGRWEGTVTMQMPGMPETTSKAVEIVRANGPFWIVTDFRSEMMGMPYEGHGCHGYDPKKGKYVGTWIDSMRPGLQVMEGHYDEEQEMYVMEWMAEDQSGAMAPHRSERTCGENAYKMVFYTSGQQTMTIEMKRTGQAKEANAKRQSR